jgi:hypothetical protein
VIYEEKSSRLFKIAQDSLKTRNDEAERGETPLLSRSRKGNESPMKPLPIKPFKRFEQFKLFRRREGGRVERLPDSMKFSGRKCPKPEDLSFQKPR